jgi:hypothetical protein
LDQLFSDDEYAIWFLDKLAIQLVKLLKCPGVYFRILQTVQNLGKQIARRPRLIACLTGADYSSGLPKMGDKIGI